MLTNDPVRYLSEILGVKCKPGFELGGCVDILSRDLVRCNDLRSAIMSAAAELEVIVKARIDGWSEGAEETVTKEQLEGFLTWLKTPR